MELVTNHLIEQRLKEFQKLHNADDKKWFSELCFCILTANARAKTAIAIQNELGDDGFLNKSEKEIAETIRKNGHRFYNMKAKYIVQARKFGNIKQIIKAFSNTIEAREFLVKNIKGIGYKEASHFLRNVGYHDVAIIDRHILRYMLQRELISEIPKVISKKKYLEFEEILKSFNIPLDKLDLIIWQKMTGTVLK
jgi:N-glycosylase/DNA lyase